MKLNTVQNMEGVSKLTPKQMIQRLSIALAQIKASNTSDKLYILYTKQKKITKNLFNNIIISMKL